MKTKHQILFILYLTTAIKVFSQAEIQNPVFPYWKVKGNSGTTAGTNFIGTTDAIDWVVKTNNAERLRVLSAGNVGIGTTTPAKILDVNGDALVNGLTIGRGAGNIATNTALGNSALNSNTTGFVNTAVGAVALFSNSTGTDNTAVGFNALYNSSTGSYNTASGSYALFNTKGSNNTGFGKNALYYDTTGTFNTAIGCDAGVSSGGLTNATAIGYNAVAGASNTLILGNGANVGIGISVPTSRLVVVGAGSAASIPNTSSSAVFRVGVSAGEGIDFGKASVGPYAGWIQSGYNGTADPLSIQPLGGNVGIGTIAPTQALDVNGKIRMQTGAVAGYVPVSDATGTMTWTNPTSLAITETDPQVSSTTTGYVPRWNGTTLVDGLIFDNTTNVGIGITVPTSKLVVVGAGSAATIPNTSSSAVFRVGVSAGEGIDFGKASVGPYAAWIQSGYNGVADPLSIQPLGGNVGIGTIAPLDVLHIIGHLRMVDGSQGSGKIMVSDANGTATWTSVSSTIGGSAWALTGNSGTTVGTNFIGTTDARALMFKVNNLQAGYIDYATPFSTSMGYQTLSANTGTNNAAFGYQALSANSTGANNAAFGSSALGNNTTGHDNVAMGYQALNASVSTVNNVAIGTGTLSALTTGHSNVAIGFWTLLNTTGSQNTAVGVNSLKANTTGINNVALGVNAGYDNVTPANSNTSGQGNTFIGAETGYVNSTQRNFSTAIGYNAKVDASNAMVLGGTGGFAVNVGIGTTTPLDVLHLVGHIRMVDGSQGLGKIMVSDANGTATWTSVSSAIGSTAWTLTGNNGTTAGTNFIGTTDAIDWVVKTNNTERLRVLSAGNIGIGTNAPVELLELAKSNANNYIRVDAGSPGANSSGVKLYEVNFDFGWNMRFDASDDDLYFEHNNSGSITNLMKLDNGGNVGIGTTTPTQKLDVAGTIRTTNFQMTTSPTANYVLRSDASGNGSWVDLNSLLPTGTNGQTLRNNAGIWVANSFLFNDGTNVGIGTTTPGNVLDVNGSLGISSLNVYNRVTGTNAIQVQGTTGIDQWINFRRGGGAPVGRAGVIYSSFGASHYFTHNNGGAYTIAYSTENTDNPSIDLATGYFVITSAANTGVNLTAPTSTLHVNGAFATTVKTAQVAGTNNPDNTAAVWIYSSGTGTITLPGAAICSGRRYVIVNQTGAAITTSSYINLATTAVTSLANNSSIEVISDATNWRQIN